MRVGGLLCWLFCVCDSGNWLPCSWLRVLGASPGWEKNLQGVRGATRPSCDPTGDTAAGCWPPSHTGLGAAGLPMVCPRGLCAGRGARMGTEPRHVATLAVHLDLAAAVFRVSDSLYLEICLRSRGNSIKSRNLCKLSDGGVPGAGAGPGWCSAAWDAPVAALRLAGSLLHHSRCRRGGGAGGAANPAAEQTSWSSDAERSAALSPRCQLRVLGPAQPGWRCCGSGQAAGAAQSLAALHRGWEPRSPAAAQVYVQQSHAWEECGQVPQHAASSAGRTISLAGLCLWMCDTKIAVVTWSEQRPRRVGSAAPAGTAASACLGEMCRLRSAGVGGKSLLDAS